MPQEFDSYRAIKPCYLRAGGPDAAGGEQTEEGDKVLRVPFSEVDLLARTGGGLRAPSAAPLYRNVPYALFPPSG